MPSYLIILGSLTIGYPAAGQVPVPPDNDCAISDDKHQGDVVSALPFDVEHPVTKLLLPADSHRTQVADLGSSLSFEKASFDVMRRSNGPGQQIVGILQTEQELKGHEFYTDVDCSVLDCNFNGRYSNLNAAQ